ncbi:hypothetical protein LCGC14_0321170 [marine sediment metagenome]|uniref:Uncharacterized protein n=1 Tax=marine sediment metagenome TaxID=412755 RepID=A0A0F9TJA5_9ZZZZ|nr:hypothetical protein [Phycisphaerae bacterium]HDZ43230.1 hypothetical protein [Phycisphaerae bacterium]
MPGLESVLLMILFVFYLYALARWHIVRRPPLFFLGALGLLFAFMGLFFTLGGSTMKVARVFDIIGLSVAFAMAVLSCAGTTVSVQGMLDAAKSAVPPSDASSGE